MPSLCLLEHDLAKGLEGCRGDALPGITDVHVACAFTGNHFGSVISESSF